jgi:hypothetical protein
MVYSTPDGCKDTSAFPCNQKGAAPANAKYGALARDGISCTMCHHIAPEAPINPGPDYWQMFYGFSNNDIAAVEDPVGIAYPFTGSVKYDLTKLVAPPSNANAGYAGRVQGNPEIWGHQQNFNNTSTVKNAAMGSGEFCGGCHVVIAPAVPVNYPTIRNTTQIDANGNPTGGPATYPGNPQKACPPVTAGSDGLYDPTTDPCVKQAFEQTTYLEWVASKSFGGNTGAEASCTYCHMPDAKGNMMAIANTESPGNADGKGGFPPVAWRADDKLQRSSNSSYPRHRLMGINLFVHEMFQQFPGILGLAAVDAAVAADTVKNLQNAEETIITHAPTTVSLKVCTPGSADTSCGNLSNDPGSLTYQVIVNNQSGHRFPTGAGFRRGFLELRLLDADGNTLWVSGAVNEQGAIVDQNGHVLATEFPSTTQRFDPNNPAALLQPHFGSQANQAITRQDQVQIYEVRATDEYGKLTTSTTRLFGGAKDNRIPPVGWVPPYDCSGAQTPITARPGTLVKGLDEFAVSLITAPSGITVSKSSVSINPAGAFSDPDFCTPKGSGNQPTGTAGVDFVLYKVPTADLHGVPVAQVKVVMHYQATPPYFLRDRFIDGRTAHQASEGGVVGLGAATERLLYVTSHLNMNIDNTVTGQSQSMVASSSTMDIGKACLVPSTGASCAPASQNWAERQRIQDVYDRQVKAMPSPGKSGSGKDKSDKNKTGKATRGAK